MDLVPGAIVAPDLMQGTFCAPLVMDVDLTSKMAGLATDWIPRRVSYEMVDLRRVGAVSISDVHIDALKQMEADRQTAAASMRVLKAATNPKTGTSQKRPNGRGGRMGCQGQGQRRLVPNPA